MYPNLQLWRDAAALTNFSLPNGSSMLAEVLTLVANVWRDCEVPFHIHQPAVLKLIDDVSPGIVGSGGNNLVRVMPLGRLISGVLNDKY